MYIEREETGNDDDGTDRAMDAGAMLSASLSQLVRRGVDSTLSQFSPSSASAACARTRVSADTSAASRANLDNSLARCRRDCDASRFGASSMEEIESLNWARTTAARLANSSSLRRCVSALPTLSRPVCPTIESVSRLPTVRPLSETALEEIFGIPAMGGTPFALGSEVRIGNSLLSLGADLAEGLLNHALG